MLFTVDLANENFINLIKILAMQPKVRKKCLNALVKSGYTKTYQRRQNSFNRINESPKKYLIRKISGSPLTTPEKTAFKLVTPFLPKEIVLNEQKDATSPNGSKAYYSMSLGKYDIYLPEETENKQIILDGLQPDLENSHVKSLKKYDQKIKPFDYPFSLKDFRAKKNEELKDQVSQKRKHDQATNPDNTKRRKLAKVTTTTNNDTLKKKNKFLKLCAQHKKKKINKIRYPSQNRAMADDQAEVKNIKASAIAAAYGLTSQYPNVKWEWLHLVSHGIKGNDAQNANNLVLGTKEANSVMLIVETLIHKIANIKKLPDTTEIRISGHAELQEGFPHLAKMIYYKVSCSDPEFEVNFEFDPLSFNQPCHHLSDIARAQIIEALLKKINNDISIKKNLNIFFDELEIHLETKKNFDLKPSTNSNAFLKTKKDGIKQVSSKDIVHFDHVGCKL